MRQIVLIVFVSFLFADSFGQPVFSQQDPSPHGIPSVSLIKYRSKKTKTIFLGAWVKCKVYNSGRIVRGRIFGIKDHSIVVKGKEIQFRNIRNITLYSRWSAPIKITGLLFAPSTYGLSLLLLTRPFNPGSFNMKKSWKFSEPQNTYVDTLSVNRYRRKDARDSVRQSISPALFFTIDPLGNLFNQHSIEIGYQSNRKTYIGIEGGIIIADCWWNRNHELYNGTDDIFPVGYYNGVLLSLHLKRLNVTRSHWFFEAAPFYKYLTYNHVHFYDSWGDPHPDVEWIRSEKTNVLGVKLLMGKRIFVSDHFALESVFGLSIREQYRSYIDYWTLNPYNINQSLNTWINQIRILPGIQAGLLLSFGNYKVKL